MGKETQKEEETKSHSVSASGSVRVNERAGDRDTVT